jgi:hypothetical protein
MLKYLAWGTWLLVLLLWTALAWGVLELWQAAAATPWAELVASWRNAPVWSHVAAWFWPAWESELAPLGPALTWVSAMLQSAAQDVQQAFFSNAQASTAVAFLIKLIWAAGAVAWLLLAFVVWGVVALLKKADATLTPSGVAS